MSTMFRWVGWTIRALLTFVAVTATIGVVCWLVERYALDDLVAVAIVALGWFAIGYVLCKRSRPLDREVW